MNINYFSFFQKFFFQKFFYNTFLNKKFFFSNIVADTNFNFFIKKTIIKIFSYSKLPISPVSWHYLTLIKFLEFCSGKKIYFNYSFLVINDLSSSEKFRCLLWSQRLRSFKRSFGAKLFLIESLHIVYTSLKLKDLYFLSNWLLKFFYKISFWKYKLIFRYLYYILRYLFLPLFPELGIKGLKFQLKGKVSVAGNSRTRTFMNQVGSNSYSTFKNRIIFDLNLIRTFTGVIGFKTWLTF